MQNYTQVNEMLFEVHKWELAFEYKRGYDNKRRNFVSQFFGLSGLEYQPNFDLAKDYLLPLTSNELHRNPNLMP